MTRPHQESRGEEATDFNDLRLCLKRHVPGLEPHRIESLGEGDFCRAYLLDGRQVLRIPKHQAAREALRREACLMPHLSPRLSLPVPGPTFYHASGAREQGEDAPDTEGPLLPTPEPGGSSFSLHERVPGAVFGEEEWRMLPQSNRDRLAGELGRFVRELHQVDVAFGGSCSLPIKDGQARARALLIEISRGTTGLPLTAEVRRSLAAYLEDYLRGGPRWAFDPALLHADISPGHVLLDERAERITGIIDWGDVAIGDPARDFIFLYEDWDGDFLTRALHAYDPEAWVSLLQRVHLQYLIDQLDWTLKAAAERREPDVRHGAQQLARGVRDLRASSNPSR